MSERRPYDRGTGDRRERFAATAWPFMRDIYGAALRMCGRREAAEDVVQETFLRAFRTFDGFTPGTNCKAWLFTIMQSVIINRAKHDGRRPEVSLDEETTDSSRLAMVDPNLTALVERAPAPEVEAALAALPPDFRAVVLLVDLEELTYEEAAQALQCPVGTVRSRLARARRQLAVALEEHARRSGYATGPERRS